MATMYQAAQGQQIPLTTLVTVKTDTDPNALTHYNQLNAATFSGRADAGRDGGPGGRFLERAATNLPKGFSHDYLADSRQYVKEGNQLAITFGFALIIIFLVLAAQFESLRDPLVIMISVPMAIVGAMIPLFFGLATMNIYTQVGLLTLVGLISKHGILMVEFANELQLKEGLDRRSAIEVAARVRLRPILMTTAAMVTGLIPLLIASGAGAGAGSRSVSASCPACRSARCLRCSSCRRSTYAGDRPPRQCGIGPDQGDRGFRPRPWSAQADLKSFR